MTRTYFLKTYGYYISAGNLPTDFALNQNYPNPFNPTTTISFALPQSVDVRLSVYNLLGQEITTLVDEHMEAGTHEVVWPGTDRDGHSVASGVYFYRLTAGEYTASRKMTLVK
jgi:methionine-rich copper-binding protein CopC